MLGKLPENIAIAKTMSTSNIFSLHGKALQLNTRADLQSWLQGVDPTQIEEIHLGGNTVGIGASEALADFLAKTTRLNVSRIIDEFSSKCSNYR